MLAIARSLMGRPRLLMLDEPSMGLALLVKKKIARTKKDIQEKSPLTECRILDLPLTLPGPYCTHLLADFGAEVIKVENPEGGDWFRHEKPSVKGWGLRFLDLNRNKKSLALNLKSPAGKEIFFALAKTAQVVVEGFRPGVVERLGIDYPRVREANPRIVYCSISGYGQGGPYRLLAGHGITSLGLRGL